MNYNIQNIKCCTCGESNYRQMNETTFKCNICNSTFYLTEAGITHKLNEAIACREIYDFERADQIYANIINNTNDEKIKAMCYFGRLLSYFGIVYVKDFNKNLVITFSSFDPNLKSIKDSFYYKKIMENDYGYLYEEQLEQLETEYQRIKNELTKDLIYDVFICTKISTKTIDNPNAEGYTEDSKYASRLYRELTNKGLKVFYSDEVLTGVDYDAQIYSALLRSKNILVISTKKEYLESSWVQSEWRRWINYIWKDIKGKDSFYLYIPNNTNIELPLALHKTQRFNEMLDVINRITEKGLIKKENSKNDELKLIKEELEQLKKAQYIDTNTLVDNQTDDASKNDEELEKIYSFSYLEDSDSYEINLYPDDARNNSVYLEIPKYYNGKKVTKISNQGFRWCISLEKIVLPDSIEEIGESAFDGCKVLTDVIMQDGIIIIRKNAFERCESLKTIFIPKSVEFIEEGSFSHCKALESINIPEKVIEISKHIFYDCTKLSSVILSENLQRIEKGAFCECSSLKNIIIPEGVNYIGDSAFFDCLSLKSITIPESVSNMGESVFSHCSSLQNIKLLSNIIAVNKNLFFHCTSLVTIELSNNVEKICDFAFAGCSSIQEIELPDSIRSIGCAAFSGCSLLSKIVIPKNVIYIGSSAFFRCTSLKSAIIQSEVTCIEGGTFASCESLKIIEIGDKINTICSMAFDECKNLESIYIPKGVKVIMVDAFKGCKSLTLYCEADKQPKGWVNKLFGDKWNPDKRPVVWGYKK